ncbi:TPA: hypothetical protein KOO82_000363 [Clostridioides difficile]|uniref:hypothetical protein n=1 Tax=Clostridioides difficile TaxID=1496 RepID=UPI001C1A8071|nr:hypothetical protein [Clostridioides difficile]HBE9527545.1 hypothetical protein [Clostridioides difficile]HBF4825632.1 hypothetical protein [Clostridioides difficile]
MFKTLDQQGYVPCIQNEVQLTGLGLQTSYEIYRKYLITREIYDFCFACASAYRRKGHLQLRAYFKY